MAEKTNPYSEWLGVAPGNRSPGHYELLGLKRFESDSKRILKHYVQRSQKIRRMQVTQPQLVTQLLNELAIACDCLTDPLQKKNYDAQLRQKLGIKQPAGTKRPPPLADYYHRQRQTAAVSPPPLPSRDRNKSGRRVMIVAITGAVMLLGSVAIAAAISYVAIITLLR